ncbi:MAG: Asp-tRNA(Asn)/Glu-tRNA(Gln) amidotransferase subunit GatC [Anaerolineales bacterium]|nr:MAG: Asp-tRNA(Asn)/Glu-tRNA(Gln) amidotransferase subunit GatC [Anaerolineales bacterium]
MKLSRDEVDHIAELARLDLSEDEAKLYQEQLSAILEHFERLQALPTEDILPMTTVLPLHSVMREDTTQPPTDREDILDNAPAAEDGYFEVPAVLD